MSTDWLSGKGRREIVDLAKAWLNILAEKTENPPETNAQKWGVPLEEIHLLGVYAMECDSLIAEQDEKGGRDSVLDAKFREAFNKKLVPHLRHLKKFRLTEPFLQPSELIRMSLKPRDTKPTPVPDPDCILSGNIHLLGGQMAEVVVDVVRPSTDGRSDHGNRMYWGADMPPGPDGKKATGVPFLEKAPVLPTELPTSEFTCRMSHLFRFPPEYAGATAYFSIRRENKKGKSSQWGPIFSTIIP